MTRKNWLRVGTYGTLGGIVLLFLAHPYTRQTAFGPRINGMPLAYWQDRCREAASPSEQVPSFTAKALRFIGIKRAMADVSTADMLPVLLSLRGDPGEHVRAHVAALLARYPDSDEAFDALIELLDDASAAVRREAARALGSGEPVNPLAMPKLRERLNDGDALCRLRAACALLRIEKQPQHATVAVLCDASKSVDAIVRFLAIEDLCRHGKRHPAILDSLRQAVAKNPNLAFDLASGLRQSGPAAVPLLSELLQASDSSARRAAAYTLGGLEPRAVEAVPALVALRDDPDESVRDGAARALWQIDPKRFAKPAPPRRGAAGTGR